MKQSERNILDEGIFSDSEKLSPFKAWEKKRWKFNRGVLVAFVLSFLFCYLLLLNSFESLRIGTRETTIILQGYIILCVGALIALNLIYFLGNLLERGIKPNNPELFRRRLFSFFFWLVISGIILFPFYIYHIE